MRRPLLLGPLLLLVGCGTDEAPVAEPAPVSSAAPASTVGRVLEENPCPTVGRGRFEPVTMSVPGVGRDLVVVTPPRTPQGVPGTPALDTAGRQQVAYDREQGVRPGSRRGNVLLNAHTFPDGSALGNRLLDGLDEGGRLVLAADDRSQCYRVTDRVEVDGTEPFPRYFATDGKPQVALVVCSGERLGPGVWTKRTVWFASPVAS